MSSHDSNARLAELIRAGLQRADQLGRTRVPLKLFPAEDQEELLTLLHAYPWDTAAPYDDEWHRSPGNILWAELLEIGSKTRHRLIPLRTDLVKLLTERGLGYRTHPRSVPVLVCEYSGPIETPVHPGDARETSSTIAVGGWGAGFGDADTNRQVELAKPNWATSRTPAAPASNSSTSRPRIVQLVDAQATAVAQMRADKISWTVIGDALGLTKQAAQARFGKSS